MKKILSSLSALVLLTAATSGNEMLEIGDKAPMTDYEMKEVMSDEEVSLKSLKKANGLLVIFSCNTCPFVLGWEDEYPGLGDLTKENEIGMVLVNSNESKRGDEDSEEAMQEHYEKAGYTVPYVIDEDHQLADAFGGKTTPHVFLFNSDMELVYRGSINDKYEKRGEEASKHYLKNAIEALASAKEISPAETRQIGCSIKRKKA